MDNDWGALTSPSLTEKSTWAAERMKSAVIAVLLPAGQLATEELLEFAELLLLEALELLMLDETLLVLDDALEVTPLGEALPLPPPPQATNSPEKRTTTDRSATDRI